MDMETLLQIKSRQSEIENRIDNAFINSNINKDANELLEIKYTLIEQINKGSHNDVYWLAYCNHNLALLYAELNNPEKAKKELEEGIKLLENLESKNSEYLALLGLMQGHSIKYCPPLSINKRIEKCKKTLKDSLEMFEKNSRALLANSILDFHTYSSYGGRKHTEDLLKSAINYANEQDPNSNIQVTWGLPISYGFLIKFYLKNNNHEQAKLYWEKAINLFPDDRNIKLLKTHIKYEN